MLWLRSFFATCYPTGEGEQGFLKIADTRYFALRGEPTTKYSGWRCDRFSAKNGHFFIFQTIFIEAPVCRPVLNFIKFLGFLSL